MSVEEKYAALVGYILGSIGNTLYVATIDVEAFKKFLKVIEKGDQETQIAF